MAETADTPLSAHEDLHRARNWLEALASGACDEATFLRAVPEIARSSPDAGWDLLSLLDQYYRRGKFPPPLFKTVKQRLQAELLGPALDLDISVPMPLREEPLTARTQPISTTATASADDAPSIDPGPAAHALPMSAAASQAAAAPPATAPAPRELAAAVAVVSPAIASRPEAHVGDLLRGRYLLQNVIGRGGMGTVFEAIDQFKLDLPNADRRIAVKVMNASVRDRPELLAELRREFQNLQRLAHPNIVRAFEYDRDGDTSFFTMEFLSGLSLARVLAARQERSLDSPHALAIVRDTGAALSYAHAHGVVHGDLNSGNVFITDEGEVRVLDFGGARLSPSQAGVAAPRFASCQVLEGQPADARDDVYSLACIAYLLLTGHHPFGDRTAIEARTARARARRPAGIPTSTWRALRAALAFDRERRPVDIAEWLKGFDFRPAVTRLPPLLVLLRLPPQSTRRGRSAALLLIILLSIGAAAAWVVLHPERLPAHLDAVRRELTEVGAHVQPLIDQSREQLDKLSNTSAQQATSEPVPADAPAAASTAAPSAAPPVAASAASPAPATHPKTPSSARLVAAPTQRARIEFAASTIDVPPSEPAALVLVRRSGNVRGDASFSWWTESGTAKPGEDFAPVAPHAEHFEDGETSKRLSIALSPDANRRQERSFYVVLGEPSDGVTIGDRALAMVTIPPADTVSSRSP